MDALMASMDRDQSEPEPIFPVLEAQAMELSLRWQEAHKPSDLKPGDLCREKRGLGSTRPPYRTKRLLIVWRLLNLDNWIDQQHIEGLLKQSSAGTDRPDCLVGILTDDGSAVGIVPHQLSQLQRWRQGDDDAAAPA